MGRKSNAAVDSFIVANCHRNDEEVVPEFSKLFYPISLTAYKRRRQRLGQVKKYGRRHGSVDSYKRTRRGKTGNIRVGANNCDITTN